MARMNEENFKDFQGLEKGLNRFQDAFEPYLHKI